MIKDYTTLPQIADMRIEADKLTYDFEHFAPVNEALGKIEADADHVSDQLLRAYNLTIPLTNLYADDLRERRRIIDRQAYKLDQRVFYVFKHQNKIQLSTKRCSKKQLKQLSDLLPRLRQHMKIS